MIGGSVGATSTELKNKMLHRCWDWDYKAPCIYLITIVIADRRSMALARLVVDNDGGGDPAKVMAHVEPSAAGRAVEAEWRRMGELTPAIKPLEIQIMPDHIHFIIRVTERLARAAEINYRGMKPSNVEGLVAEACRVSARPTGQEGAR